MTVLVVDDSEAVAAIISRIAAQGGWHAIHTTRVSEVPDLLKTRKVDLLLLDYIMPEKNGLELARQVRESGWTTLAIILFSGMAELVDKEEAARLGILRILQKPLSIAELRLVMNEAKNHVP